MSPNLKATLILMIALTGAVASAQQGPVIPEDELAALKECAATAGLPELKPGERPSQRPTRDQIETMKSCMEEKGFELRGPPRGGHAHGEGFGQQQNEGSGRR